MLDEKDLSAISKLLEADHETWLIYITYFLIGLAGAFIGGYLTQKAKNKANAEDFEEIKKQLAETTRTVKEIESNFSEKGWITQQVWLRKQDAYEVLLILLLDIKKYVSHQVSEYHQWDHIYNRYNHQEFIDDAVYGDGSLWEKAKNEYESKKADPNTKKEAELLKTKYDKALSKLLDHIDAKAIYLDNRISEKINELRASLNTTYDYEGWDEHFSRLENDTKKAIDEIRNISMQELKISPI